MVLLHRTRAQRVSKFSLTDDTNHIGLKAYLPDTIVVYDYLMYPIKSLVWWLVNQP